MLWNRAKSILIVVFLLINLFLLNYMVVDNFQDHSRALLDLTAVLSNNGIHLRVDKMPATVEELHVPELSPLIIDETFAKKLIANPVAYENGFASEDNNARLELRDGSFFYRNEAPKDSSFYYVNPENAVAKIRPYLDKLGVGHLTYAVDIATIGEDIVVEYAYRVGDYKLFDTHFSVTVTKNGVKQIKGFLGTADSSNGFSYQLSQLETVLLSLAQNQIQGVEITHIELGYYLINYQDALVSQAIPVYHLRTSMGECILDARDGVEHNQRMLSGDLGGGYYEEVFAD